MCRWIDESNVIKMYFDRKNAEMSLTLLYVYSVRTDMDHSDFKIASFCYRTTYQAYLFKDIFLLHAEHYH